jgi:hypothetical protein
VAEFDGVEDFLNALESLGGRDAEGFVVEERVSDVVGDVDGVEKAALLEKNPYAGAELEESGLAHARDVLAKQTDDAGSWLEEAKSELEEDGFAAAGGAEENKGFAGKDIQVNALKRGFAIEFQAYVFEAEDRIRHGRAQFRLTKI